MRERSDGKQDSLGFEGRSNNGKQRSKSDYERSRIKCAAVCIGDARDERVARGKARELAKG